MSTRRTSQLADCESDSSHVASTTVSTPALLLVVGLVGSSGLLGTTFKTIAGWTPVGGLSNLFSAATGSVAWGSDQVIGLVASVVYAVVFGFIGARWFRWTVR